MNDALRTMTLRVGLFMLCCLTAGGSVSAGVPHLIRYQGQAMDSKGVPLEGPYTLTFRLYDAETGGTELWKETQQAVPHTGGHFSVLLGQITPFGPMDWSKPCWLSVQVNGEPELTPRQRITSVPLAIRAERAEIAAQAEQLTVPVTTSTITDDAHTLVPSGAIILWSGASCPAGYSRVAALDGAMLKAGSAYVAPTTAGSSELPAHTHGAGSYTESNHVHNLWTDVNINDTGQNNGIPGGKTYNATWKSVMIQPSGAGPVTGSSASAGSGTVATVALCKKD